MTVQEGERRRVSGRSYASLPQKTPDSHRGHPQKTPEDDPQTNPLKLENFFFLKKEKKKSDSIEPPPPTTYVTGGDYSEMGLKASIVASSFGKVRNPTLPDGPLSDRHVASSNPSALVAEAPP